MAIGIIDVPRDTQRRGFNIEEFRSSLANHGYLENSTFQVYIQPPPVMSSVTLPNGGTVSSDFPSTLAFRIDQVRAPGISIMSSDVNRFGIGPTQKQPINAQFSEVNISMLGDHFCEFWQFWYTWTKSIFEYSANSSSEFPAYTSKYKNEYSSTMMIWIYDHYANIVQKINLYEAFPTAIREIPLAWGDPNLMKINVSIAYTEYQIEKTRSEHIGKNVTSSNQQTSGLSREQINVRPSSIA